MSRAASNKCYALTGTRIVQSDRETGLIRHSNDRISTNIAKEKSTERPTFFLFLAHEGQPRGSPHLDPLRTSTRTVFGPLQYNTRKYPSLSLCANVPSCLSSPNVISRKNGIYPKGETCDGAGKLIKMSVYMCLSAQPNPHPPFALNCLFLPFGVYPLLST
ncbi:hypothetical protein BDD12DRAFT_842298 [Trichophaea hybrida]|nr:hypothetical protein BDD12DRAFT_842298 [Trichophaea hybrida]